MFGIFKSLGPQKKNNAVRAKAAGLLRKQDNSGLPSEFDPSFYRRAYADLQRFTDIELAEHFEQYGRDEGRQGSPATIREGFLKLLPAEGAAVLEIGPWFSPVSVTPNTSYFDVMDQAKLIERAKIGNLPIDRVPRIDFVSAQGDLGIVDKIFDCVVSSHCIEHQPDLVSHLQHVERILINGGRYYVLAPDKRYCYDYFLPVSTLGSVLQAFHEKRKAHSLAAVVNGIATATHNEPGRHWNGDHGEWPMTVAKIQQGINMYEASKGSYLDIHGLQFTPESFRTILSTLYDMKLTKLYPLRVYNTPAPRLEFAAVLEKRA